jgi:hypothetical protein
MRHDAALHSSLAAAVARLLRPLIRLLLKHAMPYSAFEAVAKQVFVEAAMADFPLPGKKPSISRASILTGLTRKDVQRLLAAAQTPDEQAATQHNRATKVLSAWGRDAASRTADGQPRPLPIEGEGGFAALVRQHSGDMPVRAVLDELLRVGAVEMLDDGTVALRQRAFVPQQSALRKIDILGADVAQMIETVAHNVEHGATEPRYQRKVMHVGIPLDVLPDFRELSAKEAQALLERLDSWLSERDLKHRPDLRSAADVRTARVGLGIFYFEQAGDAISQ